MNEVNGPYRRVRLQGLNPELRYSVDGDNGHFGNELMKVGLIVTDCAAGERQPDERESCDFDSHIFVLKAQ